MSQNHIFQVEKIWKFAPKNSLGPNHLMNKFTFFFSINWCTLMFVKWYYQQITNWLIVRQIFIIYLNIYSRVSTLIDEYISLLILYKKKIHEIHNTKFPSTLLAFERSNYVHEYGCSVRLICWGFLSDHFFKVSKTRVSLLMQKWEKLCLQIDVLV